MAQVATLRMNFSEVRHKPTTWKKKKEEALQREEEEKGPKPKQCACGGFEIIGSHLTDTTWHGWDSCSCRRCGGHMANGRFGSNIPKGLKCECKIIQTFSSEHDGHIVKTEKGSKWCQDCNVNVLTVLKFVEEEVKEVVIRPTEKIWTPL